MSEKVKCGLTPQKKPTFEVTTEDVERYLQDKISRLVKKMRDEGKPAKDVKITVLSDPLSPFFRPFLIIFPREMAEKGSNGNSSDTPSIYGNDDEQRVIQLHEWLFNFLKMYSYDKNDMKAFDSVAFRHEVKISPVDANRLKRFARPKGYSTSNNNRPTHIIMYIDPFRVFSDMLKEEGNPKDKFKAKIIRDQVRELKTGNTSYCVEKVYAKNDHNNDDRKKFEKFLSNRLKETNRK